MIGGLRTAFFRGIMKHINRIVIAIITGVITGILGLLFLDSFKIYNDYVIDNPYNYIFPLIGGFLLSVIWYLIGDGNKHFGSKVVIDELASMDMQIISIRDAIVKFIGTIISICTGFLMGKVGFFIHLGGAVGSNIAYRTTSSDSEKKMIITAGVAGALAAITGSVPFAVLFVIEMYYIKDIAFHKVLYPLIASAISSYMVVILLFKRINVVNIDITAMGLKESLFYAIVLGLIGSFVGIIMKKYIPMLKEFHNNKMPVYSPIIGGLILSVIGYFYPEYFKMFVLDLNGEFNYTLMLVLLFVGLSVSMAFGAIGGEFTLLLLMGAFIGAIINPTGVVIIIGISAVLSAFYGEGFSVLVLFSSLGMEELIMPVAIATIIGIVINEKFKEIIVEKKVSNIV